MELGRLWKSQEAFVVRTGYFLAVGELAMTLGDMHLNPE
jgi:hypothetical protein